MNNINGYKEHCMLNRAIYTNLMIELYCVMYNNMKLFNTFQSNGVKPKYYYIFISILQKVFSYIMLYTDIEWTYNMAEKVILQTFPQMNRMIQNHITIFNINQFIQTIVISICYALSNDMIVRKKLGEKYFKK